MPSWFVAWIGLRSIPKVVLQVEQRHGHRGGRGLQCPDGGRVRRQRCSIERQRCPASASHAHVRTPLSGIHGPEDQHGLAPSMDPRATQAANDWIRQWVTAGDSRLRLHKLPAADRRTCVLLRSDCRFPAIHCCACPAGRGPSDHQARRREAGRHRPRPGPVAAGARAISRVVRVVQRAPAACTVAVRSHGRQADAYRAAGERRTTQSLPGLVSFIPRGFAPRRRCAAWVRARSSTSTRRRDCLHGCSGADSPPR